MPPDSKGSGASPAEPDQPTQAPPRPATNGSSAVTRPPGLRCQRVVPSGSVTWSTGSRLATTTTGLSAPVVVPVVSAPGFSPIPPPTLLRSECPCARKGPSGGPDGPSCGGTGVCSDPELRGQLLQAAGDVGELDRGLLRLRDRLGGRQGGGGDPRDGRGDVVRSRRRLGHVAVHLRRGRRL